MESRKVSALLLLAMLALSSPTVVLSCGSATCTTPSTGTGITVSPVVGGVVGTVGGAVPTVGGVVGKVSPVVGTVGGMVSPVGGTVGGMVSPVVGTVGGAVPTVGGVVGTVAPVVGKVGGAVPTVGGGVGTVAPVVGGVPVVGGIVGTVAPIIAPIIGGGSPSPKRHGGRKACPPSPPTPAPSPPTPAPTPPTPTPAPSPPTPAPTPPTPTPSPSSSDTCPIDTLKLGVCLSILGNEVHIGDSKVKCCSLVQGVAGLTAAVCLCTAIKAKVLDLSLYVPLALSLLINDCGCAVPPGYTCA